LPIEREKTPSLVARRFSRADFLQAKSIGREFA
jgi:hypothetical protein